MKMMLRHALALTASALLLCGTVCSNDDSPPALTPSCADLNAMTRLEDQHDGVDYVVRDGCIWQVSGEVTIEPGVRLDFASGAGISIAGDANALKAIGTADKPIEMRGRAGTPGSWRGIYVESNNVNNVFEHVEVRHGGGQSFNSNDDKANIILYAGGRLSLKNSTVAESATYGLTAYDSGQLTFENNTFTSNTDAPLNLPARLAHTLDSASALTGNGADHVRLLAGELDGEVTWRKLSVPYRPCAEGGIIAAGEGDGLTIEPGVRLEFGANGGLSFDADSAYLKAIGTAEAPIVFTGATEAPGAWRGLYFDSNNVNNMLDHVELAYAGADAFNSNGDKGGIIVWSGARLSVKNSTIRDLDADCGINAPYDDESLTLDGNTFTNVTTDVCQ